MAINYCGDCGQELELVEVERGDRLVTIAYCPVNQPGHTWIEPGSSSRIRINGDQVQLWTEILTEARNARIEQKIRLRERNPDDPALNAVRWELHEINRMIEEIRRAESEIHA